MTIRIEPGRVYYMGASSSPDRIWVTGIDGDRVRYRVLPLHPKGGDEGVIQKAIAQDLIKKGTQARLERLRWMADRYGYDVDLHQEIDELERVLRGEALDPANEDDLIRFEIEVRVVDYEGDAWRFIDHLTGGCCNYIRNDDGTIHGCTVFGVSDANRIIAHPHIEYVGISSMTPVPDRIREKLSDAQTQSEVSAATGSPSL